MAYGSEKIDALVGRLIQTIGEAEVLDAYTALQICLLRVKNSNWALILDSGE
jgi:hypothetical protein